MVHRVEKYADGGKVIMPKPAPLPKRELPAPQRGPKPKRITGKPTPRPRAYADGGRVSQKPPPKPPAPRPKRDTIPAPKPASAADAIRNQTRRKEQLLGLKDGGRVRRR
jgi:hypothetical protein